MEKKTVEKKSKYFIAILGLISFLYISYIVSIQDVVLFDTVVRKTVYGLRSEILNFIFIPVTYLGNWQTVTLLALLLVLFQKTRKDIGIPFVVVSISSTVIYKIIKSIFKRPRPDEVFHLIEQGGYSFPSGHSMNCIVCYGILIYLVRRYVKSKKVTNVITVLLSILIICIGFSRIYVGVHFPTDVLGGWSLGITVLCISIIILEKIRGKK